MAEAAATVRDNRRAVLSPIMARASPVVAEAAPVVMAMDGHDAGVAAGPMAAMAPMSGSGPMMAPMTAPMAAMAPTVQVTL